MTTFAEIQADVFQTTKRPDLVADTTIAIRKATMKFHSADDWLPDLVTVTVPLTPLFSGDARFSIPTNTAPFVRFRKEYMIRQLVSPPTSNSGQPLESLQLTDLYDREYAIEKNNYYYRAGNSLTLRTAILWVNAAVTYFQYPITDELTYSSWIADAYRDMITEEACAHLFKMIGKDNVWEQYRAMFTENLAQLRMAHIVS